MKKTEKSQFVIVHRCDVCLNGFGKPGVVFGYVSEARDEFECHHPLRKQRQIEDENGFHWEDAQEGDPDE